MLEIKNVASFTDEYINMMLYYIEKSKEEEMEFSKLEKILNECNGEGKNLAKYPLNIMYSIIDKYFKYDAQFIKSQFKRATYIEQNYQLFLNSDFGTSRIEETNQFLNMLYEKLNVIVKEEKEKVEKAIKSNRKRIEQATILLDKIKDGNVNEIITPYDLVFLKHIFMLIKYDDEKQLRILQYIFKSNLALQTKETEKTEEKVEEVNDAIVEEAEITPVPYEPFLTDDENKKLNEIIEKIKERFTYVDRLRSVNDPNIDLAENYKQSYSSMENRRELLSQLSNDLAEIVIIISIQELIEELNIWEEEYKKGINPIDSLQEKEEIFNKIRNYYRDYQILRQNITKKYIKEKEETIEEKSNSGEKKLIYLTTGHNGEGNVCFETGLKDIAEEYYKDLEKMLKELKDGVVYNNVEKDRSLSPEVKGYRERKEFKVRIIYKLLPNDTILITFVLPKKENHSTTKLDIINDKLTLFNKEIDHIIDTVKKVDLKQKNYMLTVKKFIKI